MPSNLVNLDALIIREDFDAIHEPAPAQQTVDKINIRDLEKGTFLYSALRKPDFQRETASWDAEKVAEFVRTFVEGELVPAIILWRSDNNDVFVIDGAHRLGALIAWVQDDYGDGPASLHFFENKIPEDQKKAAEKTRKLLKQLIGSYQDITFASANPDKALPDHLKRAKRLATQGLQVQWVPGKAEAAETSFFKINQQGTPIDATELRILQARLHANALAARAIMRAGGGHKYWSKFTVEMQTDITQVATDINDNLFKPPLKTPIKTLDLPIAGRSYSAQTLPLVFDFVNLANDVIVGRSLKQLAPDGDGSETLKYLKTVRRVAQRMSGINPASLGIHPAVYVYGANGRHQPTSFLALVALVREFEKKNQFAAFTDVRRKFEDFWLAHKHFANQLTRKLGSGIKGYERLVKLWQYIIECLQNGQAPETIEHSLLADDRFSFLTLKEDTKPAKGKTFSSDTKSEAFLKEALGTVLTCKICQGYIHVNSISMDHIEKKQDGGLGTIDNAQLTHPYCNSGYKEMHIAQQKHTGGAI